jgi:hypothetical protein
MEGELMRQLKTKLMGTCAALLLGATFAASQGLDTNRTTIVTFSAPVALPGITLPAGSYMFRLADSQTNRNIVQVFDKDRSKIYATILAIPAQRMKPADETVITFKEAPANAAPAIQYWYYPGETTGQEFAYPKKQAMEIASAAHTGVLAVDMENDQYDASKAGEISRVQPSDMADASAAAKPDTDQSAQNAQNAQAAQPQQSADMPSAKPEQSAAQPAPAAQPPATEQPTPAAQQSAQPAQPPANEQSAQPAPTSATQSSSTDTQPVATSGTAAADMPAGHKAKGVGTSGRELPRTASSLPLIGLMGVIAMLGAASVRAFRKVTA